MKQFCKQHGVALQETQQFGRGFYVTKDTITAGTVIWKESPITYALKQSVCHFCWTKAEESPLYRCGGCRFARYCSKTCQSRDWKQSHKIRCKAISKLHGNIPTASIIPVAELLTNIQPHSNSKTQSTSSSLSWQPLQRSLIPTMMHHWNERNEDEKTEMNQVSLCIAMYMKALRETFTATESNQDNEVKIDVHQINETLAKFCMNAISICDDEFNTFGIGLFPVLAILNHSCDPNVMVKFDPCTKTAEIRALRDLRKDEQLLISYTDVTLPRFMRQSALRKDYCFECKCSFCTMQPRQKHEQLCIDLCCKKCGSVLNASLLEIYQCTNSQCGREYEKKKLQQIVDGIESEYYGIKGNVESLEHGNCAKDVDEKRKQLLFRCSACLSKIDKFVGKYHWLRISLLKVMEKLQLSVHDFENCYKSNASILQFYRTWLSPHSPYLGIQYCLTGKLLNYLNHNECDRIFGSNANDGDSDELNERRKQLFKSCEAACKFFENGLKILRVSHGDTRFVRQILDCQQTAQLNLTNVGQPR